MPSAPDYSSFSLELVHDCRAELSEGPVWHKQALWWVRITDGELCRWDPTSGETSRHSFGEPLSAAVPATDDKWLAQLWLHEGDFIPSSPQGTCQVEGARAAARWSAHEHAERALGFR